MNENADGRRWWHGAVIYQLYVRSWRDTNDDGYGDLRGIIERLDHLSWLGVDAIWLSPTMPSPDEDWGYDVSDYTGVHPELGTLADLDELIAEAGRRGLRVLLDPRAASTTCATSWRARRDGPRCLTVPDASGVRGGPEWRQLSFRTSGLTIELEITSSGEYQRLTGQMIPRQPAMVDIRRER